MKIKIPVYLQLIVASLVLLFMAGACASNEDLNINVMNNSSFSVRVSVSGGGSDIVPPDTNGLVTLGAKAPTFFLRATINDEWIRNAQTKSSVLTTQYEAAIKDNNPENAAKILAELTDIKAEITAVESGGHRSTSCTGVTVEGLSAWVIVRNGEIPDTISITCNLGK